MKLLVIITIILSSLFSCNNDTESTLKQSQEVDDKGVELGKIKLTNGFDFPVGKPDAKGYYNAQKFQENHHLGDDWNVVTGGNTDLGDPIYAIANGYVTFADDIKRGWGNIIRIKHYLDKETQVESLYAHCLEVYVNAGDYVQKGDLIGTIGNNDGMYLAHLHFELRNTAGLPVGRGYNADTTGYLNPSAFIKKHRH